MSEQTRYVQSTQFADAWLQKAKDHMIVEHADHDVLIRDQILRAADYIEAFTGRDIRPREVVWRPSIADCWHDWGWIRRAVVNWSDYVPSPDWPGFGGYALPKARWRPIRAFRATLNGDDRSPLWRLVGDVSPDARGACYLAAAALTASSTNWNAGGMTSGWAFYLRTGYSKPDDTPPLIGDCLMRLVAHRYENRELQMPQGLPVPDIDQALMSLWLPRV